MAAVAVLLAVGAVGSPALPINVTCFNTIALIVGGTELLERPGEDNISAPTAVVEVCEHNSAHDVSAARGVMCRRHRWPFI